MTHDDYVGTYAVCDPGGEPVWTYRDGQSWYATDGAARRRARNAGEAETAARVIAGPLRRVG